MRKSPHAEILGLAGLFPFIGLPIFTLIDTVSLFEGLSFFTQYSAIILSFLGGVIWFDGLTNKRPIWHLYLAMLPSIIGWFSLTILPPKISLVILMLSFPLMLVFEYKRLTLAQWYLKLRVRLTAITVGGHLMMIWLVFTI